MGHLQKALVVIVLVLGFLLTRISWEYEYPGKTYTVNITGSVITFTRTEGLYFKAKGGDKTVDLFKSIGWMQGHDRLVQLCLLRLASQGLLTKYLPYSEGSRNTDIKAHQMNLKVRSEENLTQIPAKNQRVYQHFVDGVNEWMSNSPRPMEFVLLNYHPEPFTTVDVLTMFKFVAHAGLNDIFLQVEKLGLEILRETNNRELLEEAFAPHYTNLTSDLIDLYKSISDFRPYADHDMSGVRQMVNSNNWVVSGERSVSGKPIMASDPHMDISKLPGFFQELHYTDSKDFNMFGVAAVGVPGILFGRSPDITFSLTFGMLDMSDYFVENVVGKKYERDGQFLPLSERIVDIAGESYYFYDTAEGHTIERNLEASKTPIRDGKFLATMFSLSTEGDIAQAELFSTLADARDVFQASKAVQNNVAGLNYLTADSKGNIAYQQGGYVPLRPVSTGLIPLPAWDTRNHWQGIVAGEDYQHAVNPPEGWLATANNLIQAPGKPSVTTFSALSYRYDRIEQLLASKEKFSTEDFKKFQSDTHSLRTDMVMSRIGHLLSDEGIEGELKKWDFVTTVESRPAAFFKILHDNLAKNVLLTKFAPERVEKYLKYLSYATLKMADMMIRSDKYLTEGVIRKSISESVEEYKGSTYGDLEQLQLVNLLFGGRMPSWTGLDTEVRATAFCEECLMVGVKRDKPYGGSIYVSQSWRMVTDLATNFLETIHPGGTSGNPLSNIYAAEFDNLLEERYKKVDL